MPSRPRADEKEMLDEYEEIDAERLELQMKSREVNKRFKLLKKELGEYMLRANIPALELPDGKVLQPAVSVEATGNE